MEDDAHDEAVRPSPSPGSRTQDGAIFSPLREAWLNQFTEDIIDPARPIVDAHHHLWDNAGHRYLFDDALADVGSGHNVAATVYVECRSMYRRQGPAALRPIGEIEFANGIAAMSASGRYGSPRLSAAIVGHADLTLGAAVQPVLEAEQAAGGGRFRGIRCSTAWNDDPVVNGYYPERPKGMLADSTFRRGFACLAPLGLSFDAWVFHPQIGELEQLARLFPDTRIVLNHCGGPIGVGRYAQDRQAVFHEWRREIRRIAEIPNVSVKLGGLGMRLLGFRFEDRALPPRSHELARTWRPYIETCIEAFGPRRSMFESNFPPDKGQCSLPVLFNAFKRITGSYGETEKTSLFAGTAAAFYRLDDLDELELMAD